MSSADANVSTENQDPWKDRKGNYKPFYFAMILLMTWGGFALLSGIYFIWQSRRSKNNYQSRRADSLEVPPDRFPVAEMDRASSAPAPAPAQARGGGRGRFLRPGRRRPGLDAQQRANLEGRQLRRGS